MAASDSRRQLTSCTKHRLRYDPRLHDGCLLCRRERGQVAAPDAARRSSQPWGIVAVVVLFGSTALLAWHNLQRIEEPARSPPASLASGQRPSQATQRPLRSPASSPTERQTTPVPPVVPATTLPMALPDVDSCPLVAGRTATVPPRWPVSPRWHEGARGYAQAQREQERCKAPMVVYFRTDWCPYCREFEQELLSDRRVERYFRNDLVKVRLNPEDGPEERSLANDFGVTGYPSVFIVGSQGVDPRRLSLRRREDGDDEPRLRAPDDLIEEVSEQASKTVKNLVYQGHQQRQAGNTATSLKLLTRAIGLEPENAEAYFQRGLSRLGSGAREQAYEDFRSALSLRPDYRDVFGAAGRELWEQERWDEGVACWGVYLVRSNVQDGWGHLWRSKMHSRRGDHARAREDAETACQLGQAQACS